MKIEKHFQSNCSEESFSVTKMSVVELADTMLDIIQEDYKPTPGSNLEDKKWEKHAKERYEKAKKWLKAHKKYEGNLYIGWSCNYRTYIYSTGSDEILVNTCNNHCWDTIERAYHDAPEGGYNIPRSTKFFDLDKFEEFRHGDQKEEYES